MLFGIINAPAVFQALVNIVLQDMLNHLVFFIYFFPGLPKNTFFMSDKSFSASWRTNRS
jgi:hypothetical protein